MKNEKEGGEWIHGVRRWTVFPPVAEVVDASVCQEHHSRNNETPEPASIVMDFRVLRTENHHRWDSFLSDTDNKSK